MWLLVLPTGATAGERYGLIVTGAAGGSQYVLKYRQWRLSLTTVLFGKLAYSEDQVTVLADDPEPGVKSPTRENVRAALADIRRRATKDDVVLIMLIGHGTVDADEAKFNLVGPDLTADEWAALVKPIAARVVFIDTSSGSFPFLQKLAGSGRVVITANDSAAQEFETVFPEFFIKAFTDPAADPDKNGKVSVWEAFIYASAAVRQWFADQALLATEHPLLDDTGVGIGREAQSPGPDGVLAQVTYLQTDAPISTTSSELAALLKQRADIEAQIELLKARKPTLPPDEYDAALEKLLLDLARIDRQMRRRS